MQFIQTHIFIVIVLLICFLSVVMGDSGNEDIRRLSGNAAGSSETVR